MTDPNPLDLHWCSFSNAQMYCLHINFSFTNESAFRASQAINQSSMSRRTWLRVIPVRNVARHAEKKSGGAMGIMERSLLLLMNTIKWRSKINAILIRRVITAGIPTRCEGSAGSVHLATL